MKKLVLFFTTMCITLSAWAYDFQVDGIYYDVTSSVSPFTVGVTYGETKYTGEVSIPATVVYSGVEYSVTSIGNNAFDRCFGLTNVTIPNSVITINKFAFYICSGLTNITIGNSVTSIGNNAFDGCNSLTNVTIPNSVISIGGAAFYNCKGLIDVTIGNSVTSIQGSVFMHCNLLTNITIGSSVTSIGINAFKNCYGLNKIKIACTTPPSFWGHDFFAGVDLSACVLMVPVNCVNNYRSKDIWNSFRFITDGTRSITTSAIGSVTTTTALSGGAILSDGGTTITARGVCWSTTANPTTENSKTSDGTGTGTFTSAITGLTTGTTYHVRAYATNIIGTSYGEDLTFATINMPFEFSTPEKSVYYYIQDKRTVSNYWKIANDASGNNSRLLISTALDSTSADYQFKFVRVNETNTFQIFCKANEQRALSIDLTQNNLLQVVDNGNNVVGIWSFGATPANDINYFTITDVNLQKQLNSYINDGKVVGFWTPSTDDPGNDWKFTPALATISTTPINSIYSTTATSGGIISSEGGSSVTARGLCWSTSVNPTIANSKTTVGAGSGSFVSTITGLVPNTTYHVRAYATNITGTTYGEDLTFTTNMPFEFSTPEKSAYYYIQDKRAVSNYWKIANDASGNNSRLLISNALDSTSADYQFKFVRVNETNTFLIFCKANEQRALSIDLTQNNLLQVVDNGNNVVGIWSFGATPTNDINYFTITDVNLQKQLNSYINDGKVVGFWTPSTDDPGNDWKFTPALATISTTPINSIYSTTATSGGIISSEGGSSVTARGLCWSTSVNPTIANSKTTVGAGSGSFVSTITGLVPNTTYHVRAYATNITGTTYGEDLTFTTNMPFEFSTPEKSAYYYIQDKRAISNYWKIANDASGNNSRLLISNALDSTSADYQFKFVRVNETNTFLIFCKANEQRALSIDLTQNNLLQAVDNGNNVVGIWSLGATPANDINYFTITDVNSQKQLNSYINDGKVVGFWTPSTDDPGNDWKFTPALATISTTPINSIYSTTATSGGIISSEGGSSVTARGLCWSTSVNPTIANSKTTVGAGSGSFVSTITGLVPNTTYHVRAYATNSAGTAYGEDVTFTTTIISAVNDISTLKLSIFPNPSSGIVYINSEADFLMNGLIEIFSITGERVYNNSISSASMSLDLSTYKLKGIYFIKLAEKGGTVVYSKKMIFE